MASVNKVILVGNLGRDPDLKYIGNGTAVCDFSLATSEKWTDKATGGAQEKTEWHRVVVWGKLAESASKYLKKGRTAYVEGRIQTREWNDKNGEKRSTTEIIATSIVFLGSGAQSAEHPMYQQDMPPTQNIPQQMPQQMSQQPRQQMPVSQKLPQADLKPGISFGGNNKAPDFSMGNFGGPQSDDIPF